MIRLLTLLAVAVLGVAAIAGWVVEAEPDWYLRARYPLEYDRAVTSYAGERRLDPALVAAVIYAESRFDPNVRSSAGAVGLMQILPETGEFIARQTGGEDYVVADLRDPDLNVCYGTWLLAYLLERYEGDTRTALAAYHAGLGNVDGWLADGNGIAFPETRAYVDEVERVRRVYAKAYPDALRR